MRVSITLDFLRSHDHGIDPDRAGQIAVDRGRDPIAIELAPLDNQQVKVAIRPHGATSRRPKQDDLLRVGGLHDSLDDIREDGRVRLALFFLVLLCMATSRLFLWCVSTWMTKFY